MKSIHFFFGFSINAGAFIVKYMQNEKKNGNTPSSGDREERRTETIIMMNESSKSMMRISSISLMHILFTI
jgi:hypothetical protein